ncbi:hypothetical protein CWE09_02140 [Aliidiomarina minuta]|uniref:Uncharacterized protein n=1 Tax=Aliidiomarina minuta TaxID=880057 RepID=A0A432W6F7_9GAMM|nr:hypothetical protein [Aliidiomarina minuta]RUO25556.1 hypothetical protein CWE09_02140 [Aliidiomarina minuta]
MKTAASFFLPFFILMTAAGCASQKVFLNDYKLNESSVEQVQELLESEGFDVQVISVQPPSSIDSSTLLSGSRAAFGPSVDSLVKALDELGYHNISTTIVQRGNHWYRGDNIGLYLFDADFTEKPGRDVQGEYTAEDCESMETLTLTREQEFIITFADSEPLAGNWAVESMPYIHLFSSTPRLNFYYQVEFERIKDFSWEVDIVRLHPLGNHVQIQDCVLVKGLRVN